MHSTDLTVAAIVQDDGRYLLVEEYAMGEIVLNQPGGHIESGESPEEAVVREVLEETGCNVAVGELIGVYLWIQPRTRQQILRIVFAAEFLGCDSARTLDDSIIDRHWMSRDELAHHSGKLRTPIVLRCLDDFEAGYRQADSLFAGILPLQKNVDAILAKADLV